MTPQEIFDIVVTHIYSMKHRSRNSDQPACAYRAEDGSRCAVGILIPDENYHPDMENNGVGDLLNYWNEHLPSWFGDNEALLRYLQAAHDASRFWTVDNNGPNSGMKNQLLQIAHVYNLNTDVLADKL